MNNLAYMILIGALLLLAAWMLYARFVARSREKSLHHGPVEETEADYTEAAIEDEIESAAIEEAPAPIPADEQEATPVIAEVKTLDEEETSVEKKREGDYFDELQEAAAGLAVLMRSSPVSNRATPVVFAPEESESAPTSEDVQDSLSSAVMVSEPLAPKEENVEGAVVGDEVPEETTAESVSVEVADEEVNEAESVEIRVLLGDTVGDQFQKIDTSLDALEELVLSMEDGISALEGLTSDRVDESADDESIISEAA